MTASSNADYRLPSEVRDDEIVQLRAELDRLKSYYHEVSQHDQTGQDHLAEAMKASEERDAAEAELRKLRAWLDHIGWPPKDWPRPSANDGRETP